MTVVFLEGGRPTFGPKAAELAGVMYRNLYDHDLLRREDCSGRGAEEHHGRQRRTAISKLHFAKKSLPRGRLFYFASLLLREGRARLLLQMLQRILVAALHRLVLRSADLLVSHFNMAAREGWGR